MAAPIVTVDPQHPQPRHVARAVSLLQEGGLIAYPTDTYYAVGCDLFSKRAIDRLYRLKNRERDKPFSFLCPDLSDVARYAQVSKFAYRTMRALTPGAFTFVLEATRLVPDVMVARPKQVGIRVPDCALARRLAEELGHPLVTTSATGPDSQPLLDAKDIKTVLGTSIDLILDGGVQANEPSTVVSLIGDRIEILRQGKGFIVGAEPA
jgi:tRNA threonylcarbamoyl adenosine modification protein (Sua5/YciO/YrdC/YwlC family)